MAITDTAAIVIKANVRDRCFIRISLLVCRLPQMPVNQLFGIFHALEIQERGVLFQLAVQRKTDFPGPRESLGIVDRRLVVDHVLTSKSITLGYLHGLTMKIPGSIKP